MTTHNKSEVDARGLRTPVCSNRFNDKVFVNASSHTQIKPLEKREYYETSLREDDYLIQNRGIVLNMNYQFEINNLNVEAFKSATNELIRRYEILRTVFITVGTEIKQRILSSDVFNFKIEELDFAENEERDETLKIIYKEESNFAFDLERGPLLKGILCHLGNKKYKFIFIIHHALCDALSMEILIKEQSKLYEKSFTGKVVAGQNVRTNYKDYAFWQKRRFQKGKKALDVKYWTEKFLKNDIPVSYKKLRDNYVNEFKLVNTDENDGYKSHVEFSTLLDTGKGRTFSITTGERIKEDVIKLAIENRVSPFSIFLVSFNLLLFKLNDQKNIMLAIPISNRSLEETRNMIGNMMGDIFLSIEIEATMTLKELTESVKEELATSSKHTIHRYIDFAGLNFRTCSSIYVNFLDRTIVGDKRIDKQEEILDDGKPYCALECIVSEFVNGFLLDWRYNRNVFSDEVVRFLAHRHGSVLASMVEEWESPIDDFMIRVVEEPGVRNCKS